jgi:hypothetical protein
VIIMRNLLLVLVLACGAVACGEEDPEDAPPLTAPSAPAPTPRARFQPIGLFQFTNCFTAPPACTFLASLQNVGNGCALRIEGTVRFFDVTGLQLGAPSRFALPPQQIVRPEERVPFTVSFVPTATAIATFTYSVDPLWIDTPCQ